MRDPAGLLVEVKVAAKTSPARKMGGTWSSCAEGVAGAPPRRDAPLVRPRRLSHVLVFTTDIDNAIDFYTRNLGLRLSDRSDLVAFMHAIHGSDHHILAFAQSTAPGLHHCSWDMNSIDDIGLGAMTMAAKGHVRGWGLGRHVLGSNYFHYVQDPWGSFAEYSCDIDYIPAMQPWDAKYHEPEDSSICGVPSRPTISPSTEKLDPESIGCLIDLARRPVPAHLPVLILVHSRFMSRTVFASCVR